MRCRADGIRAEKADRSCGFLTETERQLLLGTKEYDSPSTVSAKRSEIATRTRHALADFAVLERHADAELKQRLFKTDADPPLFRGNAQEYMIQGMLKLVLEIATGRQFAETLFQFMQAPDSEVQRTLGTALKMLPEEDSTPLQPRHRGGLRLLGELSQYD